MNERMNITSAQYAKIEGVVLGINAIIDGKECSVPMSEGNRHYAEILKQVKDGTLTIKDAD